MSHSFLSEIAIRSPNRRSPMVLTPTPPWATTSGDVAGFGNSNAKEGIVAKPISGGNAESMPKKFKRVRLQLDARTELTDEELKACTFSCFSCRAYSSHVHREPDSTGTICRRSGNHPPLNRRQETRKRGRPPYFSDAIRCPAHL